MMQYLSWPSSCDFQCTLGSFLFGLDLSATTHYNTAMLRIFRLQEVFPMHPRQVFINMPGVVEKDLAQAPLVLYSGACVTASTRQQRVDLA